MLTFHQLLCAFAMTTWLKKKMLSIQHPSKQRTTKVSVFPYFPFTLNFFIVGYIFKGTKSIYLIGFEL